MTDGEIWEANMRHQLTLGFPWRAQPEAGRWYLYDSRGACLARFNLDSGHASRLAAAGPDMLAALQAVLEANGAEQEDARNLASDAIARATGKEG